MDIEEELFEDIKQIRFLGGGWIDKDTFFVIYTRVDGIDQRYERYSQRLQTSMCTLFRRKRGN